MYIITVIPIAKGIFKEELSYFSKDNVPLGGIVTVLVRKQSIQGFVISCIPATEAKANVKKLPYALKKVESLDSRRAFLPEFIETVQELSRYYISTMGQLLESVTPSKIVEQAAKTVAGKTRSKKESDNIAWPGAQVVQSPFDDRVAFYKAAIREEFAKGNSIFFALPTINDVEEIAEILKKGIDKYTFVFTSNIGKAKMLETWNKALEEKHPVFIIGTPLFVSIPRHDLNVFIIDKENAAGFRQIKKPYIDMRTFIESYAKKLRARFILGDVVLQTETIYKKESEEYFASTAFKYRFNSPATLSIVDMRPYTNHHEFSPLCHKLTELIEETTSKKERTILIVNRTGYAPSTMCLDCGHVLKCEECDSPFVVHKKMSKKQTLYICHKCRYEKTIGDACPHCQSWRLKSYGIGVERVYEEVLNLVPEANTVLFSSETHKTYKQSKIAMQKFLEKPSGIMVGTEKVLFYLNETVENIAVVSIDNIFTIPDFRINERAMNMLVRLYLWTSKQFILQTRNTNLPIFDYLRQGSLINFFRAEVEDRQKMGYPPFRQLIMITELGNEKVIEKKMKDLEQALVKYKPIIFPAFSSKIKGKYITHAILKLKPKRWPILPLYEYLSSLPPSTKIQVDPENIL